MKKKKKKKNIEKGMISLAFNPCCRLNVCIYLMLLKTEKCRSVPFTCYSILC